MSELIQKNENRVAIRWKLLTGVSALALTAHIASSGPARAEDADRPTVWIELGGGLNTLQDGLEAFTPPLMTGRPSNFDPSQGFERAPRHGFEEIGAIEIAPSGSDWVVGATVRYGRSVSNKHVVQQTDPASMKYVPTIPTLGIPIAQRFADTSARVTEQHLILDFAAGKDVGLGLFGKDSTSVISGGVRFAQFASQSNVSLKSDPDWKFHTKYISFFHTHVSSGQYFHSHLANLTAKRSFTGIGPSLSWKSSQKLSGNSRDAELMLDWGVNGAILFGRQKAQVHHQSTGKLYDRTGGPPRRPPTTAIPVTTARPASVNETRARSVAVPNIGGFAGLSFKYPNAKLSVGYRADFFFGAMDGGIDSRQTYDRNFYGPYATVSIGLGG